jgi:hypothetical protein
MGLPMNGAGAGLGAAGAGAAASGASFAADFLALGLASPSAAALEEREDLGSPPVVDALAMIVSREVREGNRM